MGLPLGRYPDDPIPGSRSAENPDGILQNHPSLRPQTSQQERQNQNLHQEGAQQGLQHQPSPREENEQQRPSSPPLHGGGYWLWNHSTDPPTQEWVYGNELDRENARLNTERRTRLRLEAQLNASEAAQERLYDIPQPENTQRERDSNMLGQEHTRQTTMDDVEHMILQGMPYGDGQLEGSAEQLIQRQAFFTPEDARRSRPPIIDWLINHPPRQSDMPQDPLVVTNVREQESIRRRSMAQDLEQLIARRDSIEASGGSSVDIPEQQNSQPGSQYQNIQPEISANLRAPPPPPHNPPNVQPDHRPRVVDFWVDSLIFDEDDFPIWEDNAERRQDHAERRQNQSLLATDIRGPSVQSNPGRVIEQSRNRSGWIDFSTYPPHVHFEDPFMLERENIGRRYLSLPEINAMQLSNRILREYTHDVAIFRPENQDERTAQVPLGLIPSRGQSSTIPIQANTQRAPQNRTPPGVYADQVIEHHVHQEYDSPWRSPTPSIPPPQSNVDIRNQNQLLFHVDRAHIHITPHAQQILDQASINSDQLRQMQLDLDRDRAEWVVRIFPRGSHLPQEMFELPRVPALNQGSVTQPSPQVDRPRHPTVVLTRSSAIVDGRIRLRSFALSLGPNRPTEVSYLPIASEHLLLNQDQRSRSRYRSRANVSSTPRAAPSIDLRTYVHLESRWPQASGSSINPAQQEGIEENVPQPVASPKLPRSRLPRRVAGFLFQPGSLRPIPYIIARNQGSRLPFPTSPASYIEIDAIMNRRISNPL